MTTATIETARAVLQDQVDAAGARLRKYEKHRQGRLNLIADEVKRSPEYKADSAAFQKAFSALRAFNAKYGPSPRKR